jgi:predicted permease
MLIEVLEIVAPVFGLAVVGFVWAKVGYDFNIAFITRLAMQVSMPALIFSVLSRIEMDPVAFRNLALASLVLYTAIGLVTVLLIWGSGLPRRVYLAPILFGNTGNVGLPVALFAYGEQGLADAMVVFAVMAALSFTVGIWMVTGRGSPLEALKQPIFHAAALGLIFANQGWPVPDVVQQTLSLLGQIAIPLMLLMLGVAVAQLDVRDIGRAASLSLAKLFLCALVAVTVAGAFALEPVPAGALILQAIMPVAVTNYLLATRYDAHPEAVAGLVVVSTLISVLALPVALAALL